MATIEIRSFHGLSPDTGSSVAGAELLFKRADNDLADAANPVPIPGAGTNYSFVKNLRFVAVNPPANSITNLEFWTDAINGLGTGVGLRVKTEAGYTDPIAQGSTQLAGTSDAFSCTSLIPLSIAGSIGNTDTGPFGNYIKLQATVGTTASTGTTPGELLTFSYDES